MKKLIYILTLFICCACGHTPQQSEKPVITVTLEPLRFFTEAIAGDCFEVVSMVPKGSSPESYDPTPQQLINLSKSQAYLRIGYIGFEQAWMKKLEANCPNMKVYDTSKGVDLIRTEGHWHGDHYHEGGIEPHIWNSTQNATVIADNIYAALCELDTDHQEQYKKRLDVLKETIRRTNENVRTFLENADSIFLIYHPALSYFARDYGLKQISIEEGGKEPSPATLKTLIETCRQEGAQVIFVQQEFDQRNAQLIADELGIKIVPINPLSYDWAEEMLRVASALKH
ncbi:MAG: zinc ABC transporter substrate-binding protein [Bacteroidaceae bacterium]|nr:zinc ABC transporter substrate-binding protein [Bacteroidaceae bacterium]